MTGLGPPHKSLFEARPKRHKPAQQHIVLPGKRKRVQSRMTPQASYLTTLMTHPTSPGKKSDAPVPPLPPLRRGKGVTLDVSASRWSDLGHLEPWTRRARAEASEKGELVLGRWEKMGGGWVHIWSAYGARGPKNSSNLWHAILGDWNVVCCLLVITDDRLL